MSKHDFLEAAVIFLALGFLIFGFPWVIVAVSHFTGNF